MTHTPGNTSTPGGQVTERERGPRFGALSYPQFRRYWIAQICRVLGLQFRIIALPWLVSVELERSPIWLGIVAIAAALPTIIFSVPAGVLADRFNDQKVVMWSQGSYALAAFALPFLIFAGLANIWVVIAWAILTGILAAIGNPAQQSMMPRLIEMRVMPSAVAMTSMIWSSMRIIGPAAAGVLLAVIGTAEAFFVTAVGIAISTILIGTLNPRARVHTPIAEGQRDDMWTGVRYILGHRLFLATVGLSFFTSVFGMSYQFLLPVFANEVLGVGVTGFGLMEAAAGIGSVLGTIAIVRLGGGPNAGMIMVVSAALYGLLIAGFAATRTFELSMLLLFASGFCSALYLNIGMTILQMKVPDTLRGRVMGVWSMTWFLSSIGALPAGAIAEFLGAPMSVAIGGLAVTAFAVGVLVTSPQLRAVTFEEDTPTPAPV